MEGADSIKHARSNSLPGVAGESGDMLTNHDHTHQARKKSVVDKAADKCCGSTRICWWEPDIEDVSDTVDFTQETSLHGLKYICQPTRHLVERVFWLLAFLTSLGLACWLIGDIWHSYKESPVVVTFQPFETTIDKIPFPAVTICNMNQVLKSKAEEYIAAAQGPDLKFKTTQARKNLYYMDHVCTASKSFAQKFNFSSKRGLIDQEILEKAKIRDGDDEQSDVARFLRSSSQKCTDMIVLCLWQDEVRSCSDLFKPIETDFGKCCTFNMLPQTLLSTYLNDSRDDPQEVSEWQQWDYEKDGLLVTDPPEEIRSRTFPRRQRRAGKSSGLSVLLNPDLDQYFCSSSDSQGFRLVKHLPLDTPHVVDFGIAIRPNAEIFMGIRPEITMADPDIRSFRLDKRNCYFRGEFALAYFNHYTTSNCMDECLANQTYNTCGCVRYYMPRDDTRDLCGATKFNCAENIRRLTLKTGIKSVCDFCLPTCTELEYITETTVTPIQKGVDIWIDANNVSAPWAKKNVSIVHIYFSIDSTYSRLRKELYGITDLIANTGGLMGLFLGFSGLSLIELLYFYTLRAWCRTRRRRSIWAIVGLKLHRMLKRAKQRDNRYIQSDIQNYRDQQPSRDQLRGGFLFERSHAYQEDIEMPTCSSALKHNLYVIPAEAEVSNPEWGRFSGFGSQFSNTRVVN